MVNLFLINSKSGQLNHLLITLLISDKLSARHRKVINTFVLVIYTLYGRLFLSGLDVCVVVVYVCVVCMCV